MKIIAAVDKNWAIGNKGQLLVSIPDDQKLFRLETTGKVIVMGRKTLESFPGGRPLPQRVNIVLTRNPEYKMKGALVCHSLEEVMEVLKEYDQEDVYIIGGHTVYEQFLPFCREAHITYIDYVYESDTFMENLDKDSDWELKEQSDEQTYFDLCYEFRKYMHISRKNGLP